MTRTTAPDTFMSGLPSEVARWTDPQRDGGAVLTSRGAYDWVATWSETAERLARFVQRLGASAHTAEDIVQEVAVRLLRSAPVLADADDVARWCNVVARRLYIDHVRLQARAPMAQPFPTDAPDRQDVEAAVEGRVALSRVGKAMSRLSEPDRMALLSALQDEPTGEPQTRKEATRLAVQRHRARQRLQAAMAACPSVLLLVQRGLRRLSGPTPVAAAFLLPALLMSTGQWAIPQPHTSAPGAPPRLLVEQEPQGSGRTVRTVAAPASPVRRLQSPITGWHLPRPTPAAVQTTSTTVSVAGQAARTGTAANPRHDIVCVGVGVGVPDICVRRPPGRDAARPPAPAGR